MDPLLATLMGIVLPLDAASGAVFSRLQQSPQYRGIADAATRHPKVVELRQDPGLGRQGLGGRWEMGTGSNGTDSIRLNDPGLDTLAHELTHFLLGNSQYNQTMDPSRQEWVSENFGNYGSRIPELYRGQELDEIYRALIGQPTGTAGGGDIKELPPVGGVRSFTNVN